MKKNILLQLFCLSFVVFSCSSDDDNVSVIEIPAVESAVLDIASGGSNEPNQVYIDLSTEETTVVRRDSWELGFISTENRVVLNSSILVSAAKLEGIYDIDAVNNDTSLATPMNLKSFNTDTFQADEVTVTNVGELLAGLPVEYSMYGDIENGISFTDSSTGDLDETAIGDIVTAEDEAEVFVVSLGAEIPPASEDGSLNHTGEDRGFYKIKVFMNNNDYVLQYAPLGSDTHEEVVITKDVAYNFTAFSLENGTEVGVEPGVGNWDLNYTSVYSYYGNSTGFVAGTTYSDYMVHNIHNGVGVYMVLTEEPGEGEGAAPVPTGQPSYNEFSLDDVKESQLVYDDRTVIGSEWRSTRPASLKSDRYYIIKDTDGNFYKLKFTALLNEQGERGYPQIVYDLL